MNLLRRLPLYRLLLLCGVVVVAGVSATALASALGSGPTPPAKPLAQAVHDALGPQQVEGVSASIKLTNHLLEGASLASGGQGGGLASSPLITGASGRLWISKDGRARIELQSEQGDTQIIYDGKTVTMYDAASNTVYRYTPAASSQSDTSTSTPKTHEAPSVAKIEEAISHLERHANLSGPTPTDVAGQAAYTVHISPKEGGSLLGGAELSFDASNGAPLRTAVYSTSTATPVIELAASEISYGPVADSVFAFTPPANAKVQVVKPPEAGKGDASNAPANGAQKPTLSSHGHGLASIGVLEDKTKSAGGSGSALEGLPKVSINGVSASELRTELGTVLSFERAGIRYVVAGSVTPEAIEAFARGL